jgi:hypothetical protein
MVQTLWYRLYGTDSIVHADSIYGTDSMAIYIWTLWYRLNGTDSIYRYRLYGMDSMVQTLWYRQ